VRAFVPERASTSIEATCWAISQEAVDQPERLDPVEYNLVPWLMRAVGGPLRAGVQVASQQDHPAIAFIIEDRADF
jgi:hypothetical protein